MRKPADLALLDDLPPGTTPAFPGKEAGRFDVGGVETSPPTGNRMIDQPKQAGVPFTPREQMLVSKMICLLVANGESTKATAGKLGITELSVEKVITSPQGMEMIVRMQKDTNSEPHSRIRRMATIALDVQTKLLLDPSVNPTTKAKVANEVVDRAFGKAVQVTENRTLSFDLKDALEIDKALKASQEKLRRIEAAQTKLITPVGRADNPLKLNLTMANS